MSQRGVTQEQCNANVGKVLSKIDDLQEDVDEVKLMLRGSEGRGGLVKDVNFLMNQSRVMVYVGGVLVGILSAVVTSVVIYWVTGI